ncbi:MAG: hypothetical protein IPI46_07750 [Bacteroidetes bacterium]|nr:hypothetical protein [Bacteroidota bacterium]
MKTNVFPFFIVIFLSLLTQVSFAQQNSKDQLVAEINQLLKSEKMWDYESLAVENSGTLKHIICLNPECNPYISWDFYIKNVKPVKLGKMDDYVTIDFACNEADCIIPPGYVQGGRYEMKKELQFIIKDKKAGELIVKKLNELQLMNFDK